MDSADEVQGSAHDVEHKGEDTQRRHRLHPEIQGFTKEREERLVRGRDTNGTSANRPTTLSTEPQARI